MPPKSTARLRLLETMIESIWERSYATVPVDLICDRADVRKGSFYHFFRSKTELAIAALDHLWETRSKAVLEEIFSPDRTPLERFGRLVECWYEKSLWCQQEKGRVLGCPYFSVGAEAAGGEPELAAKVGSILDQIQGYLEASLKEAIDRGDLEVKDPRETAACLLSLIEGVSTQARIHNDPERVRDLTSAFGRMLGVELETNLTPHPARS